MADVYANNWAEDDLSNSTASPDGAPEGMPPSGLNNTMRAMMGAFKRFVNQNIPKATAGSATAYTLSYTVAPAALVDGMTHLVAFHAASGANPTLNVNSLGALPIYEYVGGAWVQVQTAGRIRVNITRKVAYKQSEGSYRVIGSLGSAAEYDVGTGANNVVQLDGSGALPNLPGTFQTGMRSSTSLGTAPTGWIVGRGLTIGDASSNATERANSDTLALFTAYYAFSDSKYPLKTAGGAATTRGAQGSASAAFAAHCQITVPNYVDKFSIGAGGTIAANVGDTGGASTVTLVAGNLPPHAHDGAGAPAALGGSGGGSTLFGSPGNSQTGNGPGVSTPFSIVNPFIGDLPLIKL